MSEFYCVCQSKKGRTGLCDILPEYQKELAETREELAIYKKALELACSGLGVGFCCEDNECDRDCTICWEEHLLNKARTEK